jgi:hypothetical protein
MVYVTYVYHFESMFTSTHVSIPYKNDEYNSLPDEEPMSFETGRRHQKL